MMKLILTLFFIVTFFPGKAQDSLYHVAEKYFQEKKYGHAYLEFKNAGLAFQLNDQFHEYADCNLRMAQCLMAGGDLSKAISLAENTRTYISGLLSDARELLYEASMIMGEGYLKTGRNDLALEVLLDAENNLDDENNLKAAQCYNDLGVLYWNTGNKQTAMDYHERALDIRRELLGTGHELVADSYLNVGLIHLEEDFLQAIIYFERARKIYQSKYGDNHPKPALCYSNISLAHQKLGNFKDALSYLDLTMNIWESSFTGNHPNKAFVISSKGSIYADQGNYDQALILQQEALGQYLRLYGPKHPEVANTHYLIANIQFKQQNYKVAVESLQKSIYANLYSQEYETVYDLPEIKDYYNADILLASLQKKAQALEALHFEKTLRLRDIESSFDTYKLCDLLISKIRQLRLSESDKIRIGNTAFDVYDNGIRLALYLQDKTFRKDYFRNEAFRFCERSKSAILLEAINETKARHFAGIPDELLRMEDSLKTEITWLEQELAKGNENEDELKNQLFEYQQASRAFINRLEADFPHYYRLKYNENTVTVADLQASISPGMALLSYFVGRNYVYVFAVTADEVNAYALPRKENFDQLINGLKNGIRYRVREAFQSSAYELARQLLPPLGKEVNQLIILPDGMLGTIPFEALLTANPAESVAPQYLIDHYAISYDYAASLFYDKISAPASGHVQGILLSAPVAFDNNEIKLSALPASAREVNEINYLFVSEADRPSLLLREKASEAYMKTDKLKNYRYLHLATHGVVDETQPARSRIFLSPDESEDGSLFAGEIYNLAINADLVTLSACETGLGKVEKGEGIIGLSRSLMYAGAKNLIVSLWKVADESTAELMIEFYRQHLSHSGNHYFAQDLRSAKLNLIKNSPYKEPYYWAPFILIGY